MEPVNKIIRFSVLFAQNISISYITFRGFTFVTPAAAGFEMEMCCFKKVRLTL